MASRVPASMDTLILKPLDDIAAAFLKHRGQDRGRVENFHRLGEADDVVDDHRRLVAVQIGELVRLMVDQHEDAVFGAKQGVEASLGGHGNSLGYADAGSGAGWVEKDVEGLDVAALNPGDVGSGHG